MDTVASLMPRPRRGFLREIGERGPGERRAPRATTRHLKRLSQFETTFQAAPHPQIQRPAPSTSYNRDMPLLPPEPRLHHLQKYVAELEVERGFDQQDALQKCLLLGEEVGELFKAVRKATRMGVDSAADLAPLADELADVLIYLCCIANRFGVDLEQGFRDKETKNAQRVWRS